MLANLENSAVATGLEKVSFHSNPKERQCQRMFKLPHNCTHLTCQQGKVQNPSSQDSEVCEPRTSRCTNWIQKKQRNRRANCQCPLDQRESKEFQNNIYFCFIDCTKAFDCVDHNQLWKILQEMGIPDHLTCLLRNLYTGQEATVRTGHRTMDRFQIGKGVCQGCIPSPCLYNLYAVYIMQNARLNESQTGIKIARRNVNNLRYANDIILMAKNEEELKSILMKVKENVA